MRKALLAIAAITLATGGVTASVTSGQANAATGPCGTLTAAPAYTHVIWIMMENHSYGDIIGNTAQAPFINSIAAQCGLATNYHNISHPSLPNYVGATSGLPVRQLKPFVTDCSPSKKCSTSATSIFSQVPSWRAYEESMPSNCAPANSGEYAVRHNPAPYFTTLSGCSTFDVQYTQLASDLAGGTLPAFSFITPNLIDDMHDGTIADGDNWLAANLPTILNSAQYQGGTTAVFITWDEGTGGKNGEDCSASPTDESCHVATIVISPSTPAGSTSSALFSHYSLLGTAQQLLGLTPAFPTMASAFNL